MTYKILIGLSVIIFTISCNGKSEDNENKTQSKSNEKCEQIKLLKEIILTDTTTLDIGTKLFWNYNCESVWLTYINQNQEKIILENWTENPELSVKMGLYFLQDFKNKILFGRNVISGCCDLPDNLIFDKITGREISNIGPKVWFSENKRYPLIICFDNSDSLKDRVSAEFNKLVIYNLDNDKKYYIQLSQYHFFKDLKEQYYNYDMNLVNEFMVEKNILTLKFRKEILNNEGNYIKQTIKLNLDDYR